MALVVKDFTKETSATTGTGTYSLAGAVTGFQTFVAAIGSGNTAWYSASDGTNWEVGIGTVTDATPDTLARTTILASSNAGSAVNWGAGTKVIACVLPAAYAKDFTGDTGSGGVRGFVPAPAAGDANVSKILQADGAWHNRNVIQRARTSTQALVSLTTRIPADDTFPLVTEGDEVLSLPITPKSVANTIRVFGNVNIGSVSAAQWAAVIFRTVGGVSSNIETIPMSVPAGAIMTIPFLCHDGPATVSEVTYSVRVGSAAVNGQLNGTGSGRLYAGAMESRLVLEELGF